MFDASFYIAQHAAGEYLHWYYCLVKSALQGASDKAISHIKTG